MPSPPLNHRLSSSQILPRRFHRIDYGLLAKCLNLPPGDHFQNLLASGIVRGEESLLLLARLLPQPDEVLFGEAAKILPVRLPRGAHEHKLAPPLQAGGAAKADRYIRA